MSTKEIAARLKKLCELGQFDAAQSELFANDAISIEPMAAGGFEKESKGLDAIRAKGKQWNDMVSEYHKMEVSDPIVAGQSFAMTMHMAVTMKEGGPMDMTELCIYKVKDGKIISEEFIM
jgi:hypothetical protein